MLENLITCKTKAYNTNNYSGTHTCEAKTFLIGVQINIFAESNNTNTSTIHWIPKQDGTWFASEIYGGALAEGYQLVITGNTVKFTSIDIHGVRLVAVHEMKTN